MNFEKYGNLVIYYSFSGSSGFSCEIYQKEITVVVRNQLEPVPCVIFLENL